MKLYKYKIFIKESKELMMPSRRDIDLMCKKYRIGNYTINEDGTIDVDGDVRLYNKVLNRLPLKFGKVSGNFYCGNNELKSLEGSPEKVGGYFYCDQNRLTSLQGSPREVGGGFYCSNNKLTSLEGSPRSVGDDFYCSYNQLTSLEGISKYISGLGLINFESNKLIDVKGVKDGWRGRFYVEDNPVHQIFKLFPKERWDEVMNI